MSIRVSRFVFVSCVIWRNTTLIVLLMLNRSPCLSYIFLSAAKETFPHHFPCSLSWICSNLSVGRAEHRPLIFGQPGGTSPWADRRERDAAAHSPPTIVNACRGTDSLCKTSGHFFSYVQVYYTNGFLTLCDDAKCIYSRKRLLRINSARQGSILYSLCWR